METRLRALRIENEKTQADIAAHLHIRQNTYCQYECGKRQIPIETLISLSRFYNVSVDYILLLTDDDTPYPRH